MRMTRLVPAALLLSMWPWAAAQGEEAPDKFERAFVKSVAESPVDLWQAVARSQAGQRRVLRAGFAPARGEGLVLRLLLHAGPDAELGSEFEEWVGVVTSECWLPRRRVLQDETALADARRLHALVLRSKRSIPEAVMSSRGVKRADRRKPVIAISIEPVLVKEQVRTVSLVAIEGALHTVTQALETATILSTAPGASMPARMEAAVPLSVVPELQVPGGEWFNAEVPPTLEGLRGKPTLIVVTDPG